MGYSIQCFVRGGWGSIHSRKKFQKNTLESKAEWGKAKGFYWNDFLEEAGNYLAKEKGEDEEDVIDALCGLIKYKVKKLEHLQNIGRGDYDKFKTDLSAKGVPDSICDLLFEKYVVEATALEAIGKHAFLKEVKGLIDEEMPSLKKHEVFSGLFGLMKYPATTKVQLRNISDNKK